MKHCIAASVLVLTSSLYAMQRQRFDAITSQEDIEEANSKAHAQLIETEAKRITELGTNARTLKNIPFQHLKDTPHRISCCNQRLDSCSEWETTVPDNPAVLVRYTIAMHAFGDWNSITEIDLSDNRLRLLPLHTIITRYCKNLEKLHAAYNQITYIELNNQPDASEKSQSVLQEIDLQGNKISSGNQITQLIKHHPTITKIDASHNVFKFPLLDLSNLGKYFEDKHGKKKHTDTSKCLYPKRISPRDPTYEKTQKTLLTETYVFVTDCNGDTLSLTL
jgi:hypothetical protein